MSNKTFKITITGKNEKELFAPKQVVNVQRFGEDVQLEYDRQHYLQLSDKYSKAVASRTKALEKGEVSKAKKADLDAKGVHMSGELEKLILGDIDVEINPSESTEERDVYNCLKTLYGSREGEQALDREFGLNMDCLSLPAEAAEAKLTAEIIRKTKKYEPRAQVLEVSYETSHSQQGNIRPKVVINIV